MNPRMTGARGLVQRRWRAATARGREAGMTTAEYAVGTIAAVAFAALLIAVIRSGPVKAALSGIIQGALTSVS